MIHNSTLPMICCKTRGMRRTGDRPFRDIPGAKSLDLRFDLNRLGAGIDPAQVG